VSGRIQVLATLLGLQLLLIAGFLYFDAAGSSQAASSLLQFSVDDVDRLVISGDEKDDEEQKDGKQVELSKAESGWHLADGTPADGEKIDGVLKKLAELNTPWPVATTESSRERFEVTPESHQRHIQLFAGDTIVADLYLGTSPGYRRVHARVADADEVYSVDFSNFEVPTAANDWLDKNLLQATGDVTELTREGAWTLRKNDEGWLLQVAGGAERGAQDTAADAEAAAKVVERLAQLRVTGFAAEDAKFSEQATFAVTDKSGTYRLRILHGEGEDSYAAESDRVAGRFAIAAYIAEQVLVEASDLQPGEKPEPAADAAAGAEAG